YGSQTGIYEVTAVYGEQTMAMSLAVGGAGQNRRLAFAGEREEGTAVPLDILLLIDATGSMADEIRQLKDNMIAIALQIDALPARPDVRFGFVTYRDRGDDFLVNTFPFTAELEPFVGALAAIEARGGGDYPEDLHAGLSSALNDVTWRQQGISLIFLIADAPPHLDYPDQENYAFHLRQATAQGIKIYPIASSSLNAQGEYIFRQLAQVTNGRFIFLTDTPADAGDLAEPTFAVTNYNVADLDDLIVQIVAAELAALNP
ncbi:MAG TPA: vWA domain-containing protein, partial [Chloroflexota bacterium]|nr:vWA domain-containing protein [Chloroflexota bacterium]